MLSQITFVSTIVQQYPVNEYTAGIQSTLNRVIITVFRFDLEKMTLKIAK